MSNRVYRRKLSKEESQEKFVLITKDRWNYFPPPGEPFSLHWGDKEFTLQIEAIPCQCVGQPHFHYHLSLEELVPPLNLWPGKVLIISHEGKRSYSLAKLRVQILLHTHESLERPI